MCKGILRRSKIARGSSDFLKKNLVAAITGLKDEQIRAAFQDANRRAANALADYAAWLEREKLPKSSPDFALGEEKYSRLLAQTELVDLPPEKILEIGMSQLKAEQEAFADAAKKIDPTKSAIDVFKQIQNEHPTPENLIPDVAKDLDKIRKYVSSHNLVTIPSDVRAKVKETPQYRRATSFASMDTPGPFEKRATEAYYYVTPTEPDWPNEQKEQWLTAFKMHTQHMSVDDATKFFQENCYYEEKPARAEAMRGTFDPGYLNYSLGKLQILKLRDDYKAQEGDAFSLQKFHNELLNHGMPPIRLLRELMLKDKSKWDQVL